ncbi:Hypothetical_protein [Hexamita inflata]|uniref:Hypothetical_protein n=1 Tax=Hexamita inflata TaxID=28002 RepID=A0AA86PEM2_9EUKA|nr:Hypothetical protein HINF_LOCUS24793 [Hexamita inflata]
MNAFLFLEEWNQVGQSGPALNNILMLLQNNSYFTYDLPLPFHNEKSIFLIVNYTTQVKLKLIIKNKNKTHTNQPPKHTNQQQIELMSVLMRRENTLIIEPGSDISKIQIINFILLPNSKKHFEGPPLQQYNNDM